MADAQVLGAAKTKKVKLDDVAFGARFNGPLAKPWRLIVPWKPLPFETPEILTVSPSAKASALTVSPTVSSPASSRNSTTCFMGGASAFLRCPSSGLERCFSFTRPNASWTAS